MLKLVWDESHGAKIADRNVEKYARRTIKNYLEDNNNGTSSVYIATGLLLLAFKTLISEGEIDHKEVLIEFGEETIRIGKKGNLEHYPDGLDSVNVDLLARMCSARQQVQK